MNKIRRFKDIPQLTDYGNYRVEVSLRYLINHIERQQETAIQTNTLFEISPDFQRGVVWTTEQQIRYIEYLLSGGKSGRELYWNCVGWESDYRGPYQLVDGKQRLTSALLFLKGDLPIFGGRYISDFEDKIPYNVAFYWNVNNLKTRKAVLSWYLELNEGNIAHTKEELNRVRQLIQQT